MYIRVDSRYILYTCTVMYRIYCIINLFNITPSNKVIVYNISFSHFILSPAFNLALIVSITSVTKLFPLIMLLYCNLSHV